MLLDRTLAIYCSGRPLSFCGLHWHEHWSWQYGWWAFDWSRLRHWHSRAYQLPGHWDCCAVDDETPEGHGRTQLFQVSYCLELLICCSVWIGSWGVSGVCILPNPDQEHVLLCTQSHVLYGSHWWLHWDLYMLRGTNQGTWDHSAFSVYCVSEKVFVTHKIVSYSRLSLDQLWMCDHQIGDVISVTY